MASTSPLLNGSNRFAYYRSKVQEAKTLHDEVMKDVKEKEARGEVDSEIDVPKLLDCHELCASLLQEPDLPHQFQVILNLMMATGRETNFGLTIMYFRRALVAVEHMERLGAGSEVPFRAMIEAQLRIIEENQAVLERAAGRA